MVNGSSGCRSEGARQNLTKREAEVAALVAQGLKNYSIARHLSLSPATVATYVQRIQSRLGVSSRDHITAWVTTTHRVAATCPGEPHVTCTRSTGTCGRT